MNDIILSGLLNLFALFGALTKVDKEKAKGMLSSYLTRHFGVRSLDSYLGLYSDLREFYDDFPDLDKDKIVEGICSNLQHKILAEEQALLLLRFMEFCSIAPNSGQEDLFKKVAELLKISDSLYRDFCDYVSDTVSDNVLIFEHEGIEGKIKTLNIREFNKLIFTYEGAGEVMLNDVPVLPGLFLVWERSGMVKSRYSSPLYYSNIIAVYEKQQPKDIIELTGKNVNFRFPGSDNGMHDLSFSLRSGQLVAIMGGSGVGKSTLLSLLNGNLKPQEGTITLNGYPISDPKVKDLIGFVPQDDLLIEELTVYQNLWFTARLCFDKMDEEALNQKVNNVLIDLGLEASKDLKVGSAINKYISGGQRKRLNIALELIREPAVLFLDEPTSGLSSSDSEKVINLLKEQTYRGRLIVVNIHQPSSDIFKLFDKLWLLDKGGYPVYDGNPIEAVTYFKNAAEYADADTSTCPTCGNVNPEVVLDIIDAKALSDSGQITQNRKVTPKEWHERYLLHRKEPAPAQILNVPVTDQKKPNPFKQLGIFLSRNLKTKITNTQYLLITLLEAPLLAVIVALLTRYSPPEGYTIMDNKNIVSYFFMAVIVAIFIGMSGSAEEIFKDRALLKRERFLRLSQKSYIWSKILFMAGISLIQTFLFVVVGNSIMGIHDLFFVWWMILFISAFLANLTGLVLSQSLSSIVAIYITIPLLLIPQILLCGLVVKFDDLTPNSRTGNVPVIGEIIPSRWAFEALAVTSFTSNEYEAMFFENEKEKYTAQYYYHAYLYEMQSQLETSADELFKGLEVKQSHFDIIVNSLPKLAEICEMEPYYDVSQLNSILYTPEIYFQLDAYFQQAETILKKRCNYYNIAVDKDVTAYISENGKDELLKLKRNHYNLFLEDLVINADAEKTHRIVGNTILPKAGYIFIDPSSKDGRAPFYSSTKILGNCHIPTLWYNMGVLLLMCILTALALFFNFPGKFLIKERN